MINITLYTRPECSLCEKVKRDLAELQAEYPHRIVERNIEADAQLLESFRHLIPVVEIDKGALVYPPHDWLSLRNALAGAAARQPTP